MTLNDFETFDVKFFTITNSPFYTFTVEFVYTWPVEMCWSGPWSAEYLGSAEKMQIFCRRYVVGFEVNISI